MDDEKSKQYKLIQSGEWTVAVECFEQQELLMCKKVHLGTVKVCDRSAVN